MIEKKFTTTFTVLRQEWTTEIIEDETIDKSEEIEVGSFFGYRQQTSAEYVQGLGLQISKPHSIWCPVDTEVAEGDTLSSNYGIDKVKAIQINGDGFNAHKEVIVEFIGSEISSISS